MIPELERLLTKQLHRYAVSTAITCPDCGDILDVTRAVLITGPTGSRVTCLQDAPVRGTARYPTASGDPWQVIDGSVLYARPPRAPRRRRTP